MSTRIPVKKTAALALFIALGIAGNYLSIPFFFGINFIFGSIATIIIIRFLGTGWGTFSALLISAYTYQLWGHSIGLVTFVLEALIVGLLAARYKGTSLLLLDGIFWMFMAAPAIWFVYTGLMDVDATGTILIFLKQSVNGLFNALVAVLAYTHLPLYRWLFGEEERKRVPVSEALFNLLVAFLMLPALLSIVLISRHEVRVIYREVETLLSSQSEHALRYLQEWRDRNHRAVNSLVGIAAQQDLGPHQELRNHLSELIAGSPDLLRLSLLTPSGQVVASESQGVARGAGLLPLEELRPQSEIRAAMLTPGLPVIVINEPVWHNGKWVGTVEGILDSRYAHHVLQDSAGPFPLHLTLLDPSDKVMASSRPDLSHLQAFNREAGSKVDWVGNGRYTRSPAKPLAAINRWRKTQEVLESPVPGEGDWVLVAEVAMAPYRSRLYRVYNGNLVIILLLTIGAMVLSALLSRLVAHPLRQLTAITRYLPQRLKGSEEILWPASPLLEIDALAGDVRWMVTALREQFDEIEQEARQQRALLSAAMEATDVPVLITDDQERIVYVNPPFLQAYGYTPDEVLGRRPLFLHSPHSDRKALNQLRSAVQHGKRITLDLVNARKDGTPVETELVLSPLRASDGKVTHYVGIYRDMSARKATANTEGLVRLPSEILLDESVEASRVTGGTLLIYAEGPVADSTGKMLGHSGFTYALVQTGTAAWDALSTQKYDTLVLDPQAPGAVDFLYEMRQSLRFADLPVVVIGRLKEGIDRSLLEADPTDPARFTAAVRTACSRTA